ncbi:MAG: RHS repeat domain-containing protein [Reichenbachiella sp.]|uniref:RHS repeat protein n=1 Tax=Reichenbachiella sp. TaxID=2184521 RepID=UPI003267CCD1
MRKQLGSGQLTSTLSKSTIAYLVLTLFFQSSIQLWAQGGESSADFNPGEINILPPSPTAGALGQYGLSPVSLSTGTPNISVPIHQISYRGISVPISLSYSSSGLKVDEVASWVGQGWSLNAGGVITRVIKDEADEERGGRAIPENLNVGEVETLVFIEAAQGDGIDTEPDLYMFNFNGYNGKFVISDDRSVNMMPAQKLNVGYSENGTLGYADFYIQTPDGIQYVFSDYETSRTYNLGCGKDFNLFSTSAWYLTKITHPNGAEVLFNYESSITEHYSGVDQTFQERVLQSFRDCQSGYVACGAQSSERTCVRKSWVNSVKLESIIYGTDSTVFTTSDRTDVIKGKKLDEIKTYVNGNLIKKWTLDHETVASNTLPSGHGGTEVSKRLFLNGFKEWDQNSTESKDYVFEYIDKTNLPARLSFAQDHWGYFNGKNNTHFVPDVLGARFAGIGGSRDADSNYAKKGMLHKITYPTGGYSQFDFEANAYYDDSYTEDIIDLYSLDHFSDDEVVTSFQRDTLVVNHNYEPSSIIFRAAVRPSHQGFEFVNCTANIRIYRLDEPNNESTSREYQFSFDSLDGYEFKIFNQNTDEPFMFSPGVYAIEISAREFIEASLDFDYKSGEVITPKDVEVGGMRIKKETIYDGINTPQVKSYYYAPFENLNSTSISKPQTPVYMKYISTEMGMVCEGQSGGGEILKGTCTNVYLYSSSQSNLFPISGSHIYYDKVLVADGENFANGFTEHDFLITRDNNPKIVLGEDITSATYSNIGWDNGLESKVTHKDSQGQIVYQKENEWLIDSASTKSLQGVVIHQKNADWLGEEVYYACNESNTGLDKQDVLCWSQYKCITDHEHDYSILKVIDSDKCRADGRNMQRIYLNCNPCMTKNPGDTVIWIQALSHLNVVEYQNYSFRHFLGSTLETTFNPDGTQLQKRSTYKYDNPDHMQLTAMETLTSRADTLKTFYYYPADYTKPELLDLADDKFLHALPVRVDMYRNDKQLSSVVVKYDTIGQPTEVHRKIDLENTTDFAADVWVPITGYQLETSLQYDPKEQIIRGRLPRSGINEAYLWNNEGTLVLASAIQADTARLYYENFESSSTSNAYLGSGGHNGVYNFSTQGFSPTITTDLKMSYWKLVNGTWEHSGELDFNNVISESVWIDEVIVYPKGAHVTTYFYDDYDRLIHVTDPKNRTITYSYDAFGRLSYVKDHEGHVLSAQEYHYKNPISN